MSDYKLAISVVQGYIDEHLFEPAQNWPPYYFKQRSYARWAAKEVLKRIQEHEFIPPILVVEEFVHKMYQFSQLDHNDQSTTFIFSTAHDTATDILDILRAMQ